MRHEIQFMSLFSFIRVFKYHILIRAMKSIGYLLRQLSLTFSEQNIVILDSHNSLFVSDINLKLDLKLS